MKTSLNGAALSRRTLLAGSALVAAGAPTLTGAAGLPQVLAAGEPVHEPLTEMCARCRALEIETAEAFDRTYERIEALIAAGHPDHEDEDWSFDATVCELRREEERLDATLGELRRAIESTPARTAAGVFAKLDLWAWEGNHYGDDLSDHAFVLSALRDARRLGGPADGASTVHQLAEVCHG